jgi:hypothetical protein
MTQPFKLFAFVCDDPACPPGQRVVVKFFGPSVGVGGKTVQDWLPTFVPGSEVEPTMAKAEKFITEQLAKHSGPGRGRRKSMEAPVGGFVPAGELAAVEEEEAI